MATKRELPNTCKTCRWLSVKPDRGGRRVVRKLKAYRCVASLPDIALPLSVTDYFTFKWPPLRRMVSGDEGENCPTWKGME